MIRKTLRLTALSATALFILGTGILLSTTHQSEVDNSSADENVTAFYTVREYENAVGVFASESSVPEKVHTLFVRALPEADRAALKSGIHVASEDELRSLIEDLTG